MRRGVRFYLTRRRLMVMVAFYRAERPRRRRDADGNLVRFPDILADYIRAQLTAEELDLIDTAQIRAVVVEIQGVRMAMTPEQMDDMLFKAREFMLKLERFRRDADEQEPTRA